MIYYVLTHDLTIFALLIYGKNEQSNISSAQRKALLAAIAGLKRRE